VPPTDEELIEATLAGDLAAFDTLMQRYERLVFRIGYGFAEAREGALDIVQGSFLKALRNLTTFQATSSFKTWLVRIALNEGQDYRRRHRRRDALHEPLDLVAARAGPGPDPESSLLRHEEGERLRRGLAALNPRQSLAVKLRYFHELSVPEIAASLSCSQVTARNILFRGLRRLRETLQADDPKGTP